MPLANVNSNNVLLVPDLLLCFGHGVLDLADFGGDGAAHLVVDVHGRSHMQHVQSTVVIVVVFRGGSSSRKRMLVVARRHGRADGAAALLEDGLGHHRGCFVGGVVLMESSNDDCKHSYYAQ